MAATSQRLLQAGLPVEEYPQTSANLTACSQNLYELIQSQGIIVYADPTLRLAVSRAIAVETPRGWRISKQTQAHKIDVVVALAMAAHAAVQSQSEAPALLPYEMWVGTGNEREDWYQLQRSLYFMRETGGRFFG
jgi:phage terminase large subunit-like protein